MKKLSIAMDNENEKLKDITIECKDCKRPFIFTVNDQIFFKRKGWVPPLRCKPCRIRRKEERGK